MKFKDILAGIIVMAIAVILWKAALVIICLIAALMIFLFTDSYIADLKWKWFMKENEGNYFLWYSSRKEFKTLIEEDLKPLLSIDYKIIYNNRNMIESHLTDIQLRRLRNDSASLKLPLLIRIKEGNIFTESLNEEVTKYKKEEINKQEFEKRVNQKLKNIA